MQLAVGAWRLSVYRIPPTQPELARLYDGSFWWGSPLYRAVFRPAYQRLFVELQRHGWLSDREVLDCGIGTGLFSDALICVVGNGVEIHGVDISPKMLEQARALLTRRGVEGKFECRDARFLPLEDGSMNLVLSAFMLEHASDPLGVLREMARVARSDATLVLVLALPCTLDFWFRLRYRYRPLEPARIADWMATAGWNNVRQYPLRGIARLFGRAYIGRKTFGHP